MTRQEKINKIELLNKIQAIDMNISTINRLDKFFESLIKEEIKDTDAVEDIIVKTVAKNLGVDIDLIFSKSRKREHVIARFFCYKLEEEFAKKTYSAIGKRFNRDHSSIIQGLWSLADDLSTDYNLSKKFKDIRNEVMHEIEVNINKAKVNAKHKMIKKAYLERKALHPSFGRPKSYMSKRARLYNTISVNKKRV